ncbi:MAG: hypothetical protein QM539_04935 [Alphaproteobacteria bacterium]|nr:hypothetical protein [Alphaproteobacteria bacterium]
MKFYNFLIRYRLSLSCLALILGILLNVFYTSFWPVFPLYLISVIGLVSHFLIGPLRLIQEPMEKGQVEEVQKILKSIKYPGLLIKPVRATYYTILGNMSMLNQDFATAEKHLKKSSSIGSSIAETDGANKLQLGMMAIQKGNIREGESYLKHALRIGIPDKESESMAHLGLCQIYIQRREYKAAKMFFRKAKDCKPKTKQLVDQINEMNKYISRIPG